VDRCRPPWSLRWRKASSEQLPLAGVDRADPYGEDLTLALYTCYELHYRGFDGVDPLWEWEPELLRLRAMMERAFLTALRSDTDRGDDVTAALDALLIEPVPGNGSRTTFGMLPSGGTCASTSCIARCIT
jgi:hypothetical protein